MGVLYRGIDVSTHQNKIDWERVKATNSVDFVMIRIGFRGSKDGIIEEDKYFQHNIDGASKNGFMIGAYFFSTAINEYEAIEEAKYCIEKLKKYDIKFPVVYDLEGYDKPAYRSYGISKTIRTNNCKAFITTLANAGYTTMIYGSKGHIRSKYNLDALDNFPIWVATYPSDATLATLDFDTYRTNLGKYTDNIVMWQYSNRGRIDGINAKVDMDVVYVDIPKLKPTMPKEDTYTKMVTVDLPVLKKGVNGEAVEAFQILMNYYGYTDNNGKPLEVDSQYGNCCIQSSSKYQVDHPECGTPDGMVGAKTWTSCLM